MTSELVLQVGVKALIERADQYLMLKRSLKKYPEIDGRWDIVGGRINPGVSLIANLEREMMEETGLKLVGSPRLIAAQDILRGNGRHVVRLTYIAQADGQVKLDTEENEDYKWFSLAEIKKLEDVDVYFKEVLSQLGV